MSLINRRSKLELKFEDIIKDTTKDYQYEVTKIKYIVPESEHVYTVDWTIHNTLLIETKGYLSDYSERKKYELIKKQHPDLNIKFVFDNPNKLCGGTKMTHGKWAEKNNFDYCGIKDTEKVAQWIKENEDISSS